MDEAEDHWVRGKRRGMVVLHGMTIFGGAMASDGIKNGTEEPAVLRESVYWGRLWVRANALLRLLLFISRRRGLVYSDFHGSWVEAR